MKNEIHRNNAREYTAWDMKTRHNIVIIDPKKRRKLNRLFKHMAKRRMKNDVRNMMKEV